MSHREPWNSRLFIFFPVQIWKTSKISKRENWGLGEMSYIWILEVNFLMKSFPLSFFLVRFQKNMKWFYPIKMWTLLQSIKCEKYMQMNESSLPDWTYYWLSYFCDYWCQLFRRISGNVVKKVSCFLSLYTWQKSQEIAQP